jgi:hypothetical protein
VDEPRSYALKFISGKYQGGEFPLREEGEIIIGRSSDIPNGMVLVEDMVSRKHAKIICTGANVVIQDLGSTNGTFVNGEKVKKARLKEGDRILIGTSILKLIGKAGGQTVDEAQAKSMMAAKAAQRTDSTMSGRIEDVPVPDLLQLFQTSKRSGVLVIKGEETGRIYLREGLVYYAVIGDNHDLGPLKAFNRMVSWESGLFELQAPSDEEFMIELDEPTEALLMEALRQLDEFRRIEADLPARESPIALESPIAAALRDLSPEQLDVLQLVHNFSTVEEVFDGSDFTDLETAQHLLHLIQKGYAREG